MLGADPRSVWFVDTDLSESMMNHVDLSEGLLVGVDVTGAVLSDASLRRAILSKDNFIARGGHLGSKATNLSYVNLRSTDFSEADLRGVNLRHADLTGSKLTGAELTGAELDGQAQLDEACGTDVKLPADLTVKPCPEKKPSAPPPGALGG